MVILLVAVLVIPARLWPDVARSLARAITFVRKILWRITDAGEQIKQQIDLEKPIDDLIRTTTADVLDGISTPIKELKKSVATTNTKKKRQPVKKSKTGQGK